MRISFGVHTTLHCSTTRPHAPSPRDSGPPNSSLERAGMTTRRRARRGSAGRSAPRRVRQRCWPRRVRSVERESIGRSDDASQDFLTGDEFDPV